MDLSYKNILEKHISTPNVLDLMKKNLKVLCDKNQANSNNPIKPKAVYNDWNLYFDTNSPDRFFAAKTIDVSGKKLHVLTNFATNPYGTSNNFVKLLNSNVINDKELKKCIEKNYLAHRTLSVKENELLDKIKYDEKLIMPDVIETNDESESNKLLEETIKAITKGKKNTDEILSRSEIKKFLQELAIFKDEKDNNANVYPTNLVSLSRYLKMLNLANKSEKIPSSKILNSIVSDCIVSKGFLSTSELTYDLSKNFSNFKNSSEFLKTKLLYLNYLTHQNKFTAKNSFVFNDLDNGCYFIDKDKFVMYSQNFTSIAHIIDKNNINVYAAGEYSNTYDKTDLLKKIKNNTVDKLDMILQVKDGEITWVTDAFPSVSFDLFISISSIEEEHKNLFNEFLISEEKTILNKNITKVPTQKKKKIKI